jgi:hypothetical protein
MESTAEADMKTWFDASDRRAVVGRLDGLKPTSTPRWGRMTAHQTLCHLADPIRVALGEKVAAPVSGPLRVPGLRHAVVWILPWPKGAPTAPDFLAGKGMTKPTNFQRDKRTLLILFDRLASLSDKGPIPEHPLFGAIGRSGWGRLMWRHVDHHLRQFGL